MRSLHRLGPLALLLALALSQALVAAAQPADQAVENGWFSSQTGPGDGTGFGVTDRDGIPFWTEFQNAGGVARLGYPVSRRWMAGPFTYQAFHKAVLQWQPGQGVFYVNIYDNLSAAGFDDWLLAAKQVPRPRAFPQDSGQPFSVVVQNHVALLDENAAIKAAWNANPNWLRAYGLPVAYQDFGGVRVLRAQRAVLQQWVAATSFTRAGAVVVSNGGDHYKQAGLILTAAAAPHAVTETPSTVTPTAEPSPTPVVPPTTTTTVVPAEQPNPAPEIGSVTTIVASPLFSSDRTVWVGKLTGGIARSTDGGVSYARVNRGLGNLAVHAVAPSPAVSSDNLVLAGTNTGIYRSTDKGATWGATTGLPAARIAHNGPVESL
ncbi:MAG: hypothetical protein FJ029_00440 [Actinobacteria bacterium]|nr:hypothetical protein [Actinomycetota bacterium]